jgi:hypothetical protein
MKRLVLALLLLLGGCHGSTLDAIYPGTLGHQPPPAVDLPAGDCAPSPHDAKLCAQ